MGVIFTVIIPFKSDLFIILHLKYSSCEPYQLLFTCCLIYFFILNYLYCMHNFLIKSATFCAMIACKFPSVSHLFNPSSAFSFNSSLISSFFLFVLWTSYEWDFLFTLIWQDCIHQMIFQLIFSELKLYLLLTKHDDKLLFIQML